MSDTRNRNSSSVYADVRKPRLLQRGLLVYALLVLMSGWSYGFWQINADRARTLEGSSNQLIMTATVLAGHMEAMINDGVGAAVAGANEVRARDRSAPLSQGEMSGTLARMLTGGEYVHTLFIVTQSMYVDAQNGVSAITQDRPAWAAQLMMENGDTWVGKPLYGERGDMNVLIPIARRTGSIRDEATWAGALFSVYSLDQMYRSLPIERAAVSMTTLGGTLLVRLPTTPGVNYAGVDMREYDAYKIYNQSVTPPLTITAPDSVTGKPRQYAVLQVPNFPVVAVAGRNIEDSLLAWQKRRSSSVWTLLLASIALMLLAGALYMLLKRRFAAVTRSEQRFQLAVAGTNDGIWEWDTKTNRVYFSPRFKQLLGLTDSDAFVPVLDTFWQRVHPDDVQATELAVQRHLLHRDQYDIELRLRTRDDLYKWFRARGQAVWDEQGDAVRMAGSISYIHDKKLAEANLEAARQAELDVRQELTQNLLLAQEQERQRLANELHDSVGQNLSLIKNHALLLLQHRDLSPTVSRHVTALEELATDVIGEVRTVARNLRPLHIEELGLTDAINTLVTKVSQSGKLVIEGHLEDVQDVVQGSVATHLYRIAQEALNNMLKHAQASRCRIALERDINCVRLVIDDDGVGFEPGAPNIVHGIGLSSIAERARILHAKLNVESVVGRGTTVSVEVPIAEIDVNTTG